MKLIEKKISREDIFSGRVFNIHVDTIRLPNDAISTREVVEHHGGVSILALDDDDNIMMVRQFRYGADDIFLEIPAGKLEFGEDPAQCGIRELREETGMNAAEYKFLAKMYPTPAYCSECIHIYLARGLTPAAGGQNLDDGEFLQVERVPFAEALRMCMNGEITDAKTLVAIFKYANFARSAKFEKEGL